MIEVIQFKNEVDAKAAEAELNQKNGIPIKGNTTLTLNKPILIEGKWSMDKEFINKSLTLTDVSEKVYIREKNTDGTTKFTETTKGTINNETIK